MNTEDGLSGRPFPIASRYCHIVGAIHESPVLGHCEKRSDVAIPSKFRNPLPLKQGIPTPVFALARNDRRLFSSGHCDDLQALVIGSGVCKIESDVLLESSNFSVIYYHGTQQQWNQIQIFAVNYDDGAFGGNKELKKATLYFYSETVPTEPGNYWHYVDGKPTPWETEE